MRLSLILRYAALTFVSIALLLFPLLKPTRATTIDPLIWEQLVADADFIGIVQCETAGGVVAEYKVLESWKGVPVGTKLSIRVAVNFWGPQFPVTLFGERYLVTAFKADAPSRMISTTSGTPVPLWWRRIPADYSLPLWQGRVLLPLATGKEPLSPLGSEHKDLNSFRAAAQNLLALSPEAREALLLQRLASKYVFGERERNKERLSAEVLALKSKILSSSSATEISRDLIEFAKQKPDERAYPVEAVLKQGGGAITLKLVETTPQNLLPFEARQYDYIIRDIRRRVGLHVPHDKPEAESAQGKPPTDKELAEMRKLMAGNPTEEQFSKLFDVMTRYDPAPIAEYLGRWVNKESGWSSRGRGYLIGSYFAWACGKDREANLRTLLKAHDPYIRVAGAVYLTFEDRDEGMAQLKELSRLADDPGVWAAINVARRGDKSAVPRALEVFKTAGASTVDGEQHRNLQKRVLLLFSNSAGKSGIPQPSYPIENYELHEAGKLMQEKIYQHYVEWWEANQEKLTLYDPWLSTLEEQKVD